jgi:hypothetical protein
LRSGAKNLARRSRQRKKSSQPNLFARFGRQ